MFVFVLMPLRKRERRLFEEESIIFVFSRVHVLASQCHMTDINLTIKNIG